MRTNKFFIIILLILIKSITLRAQYYNENYSKFLPSTIRSQKELKQINSMLNAKGSIHPELIYYYIMYFRYVLSDTNLSSGIKMEQWQRLASSVERNYLLKRNNWANKEMNSIQKLNLDREVQRQLVRFYSSCISYPPKISFPISQNISVDSALMNYFVWNYYNPLETSAFDRMINYGKLRDNSELLHKNNLVSLTSRMSGDENEDRKISPQDILDSWYLFDDSANGSNMLASQCLVHLIQKKGSIAAIPNFSVSFLYAPAEYLFEFQHTIPIVGSSESVDLSQKYKGMSAGFAIGYRHFLRSYFGAFSYINVQLAGIYMISHSELNLPKGYSQLVTNGTEYSKIMLTLLNGRFVTHSIFALYAKLSAPIAILFGRAPLEIGVLIGGMHLSYELEYDYRYAKSVGYVVGSNLYNTNFLWYDTKNNANSEFNTQWNFFASPEIDLNIPFNNYLSFDLLTGLRSSYVSANFNF